MNTRIIPRLKRSGKGITDQPGVVGFGILVVGYLFNMLL